MEHRWGNRHEVSRPVRLATRSGTAARGQIRNVSVSGAFIASALDVGLFSDVRVQFTTLLDSAVTTTMVEGQVVRKSSTGFGIEWRELEPEAVSALVVQSTEYRGAALHPHPEPRQRPSRNLYPSLPERHSEREQHSRLP
jgi:hypothetical protein